MTGLRFEQTKDRFRHPAWMVYRDDWLVGRVQWLISDEFGFVSDAPRQVVLTPADLLQIADFIKEQTT